MKKAILLLFFGVLLLLTACTAVDDVTSPSPDTSEPSGLHNLISDEPTPDVSLADSAYMVECYVGDSALAMSEVDIMTADDIPVKASHNLDEPAVSWRSGTEVLPEFSLQPTSYELNIFDREGAPIKDAAPGVYPFSVTAEFAEEDWSGTLTYIGEIYLLAPKVTMPVETAQGEVAVVLLEDGIPGWQYKLHLPHIGGFVDFVQVSEADNPRGTFIALAPINVTAKPDTYLAELDFELDGSLCIESTIEYTITATAFTRQDLQTSGETQAIYTNENLSDDNAKVAAARENSNPEPYFEGKFIYPLPTEARVSTEFAEERYVNGKFQSRHSGIDLAAAQGTDIYAVARGRVAFADELIVNGNTVIIDHGMGIFSAYSHLSVISVEQDDMVEQGAVIGLVGSTGYSTGPHLHYTVMVSGYYVNPMFLMENDILERTKNID